SHTRNCGGGPGLGSASRRRTSRLPAAAGRVSMVDASVFCILWGAFLTVLFCWSAGKLLFGFLAIELGRIEEDLLALVSGAACVSTVIFLLCAVRLGRKGAFTWLAVATVSATIHQRVWVRSRVSLPAVERAWILALAIPVGLYTYIY